MSSRSSHPPAPPLPRPGHAPSSRALSGLTDYYSTSLIYFLSDLIKIYETVRTAGHFYLVEEFLPSHVSLDTLCMAYPSHRLPISLVQHILNQLVSVARDAMHSSSVCHRDIKPENVMVNPEDGHITLIDLGLSTHYSLSAPKLTTCCGSPAFHCPEIVKSLSLPPGVVTVSSAFSAVATLSSRLLIVCPFTSYAPLVLGTRSGRLVCRPDCPSMLDWQAVPPRDVAHQPGGHEGQGRGRAR